MFRFFIAAVLLTSVIVYASHQGPLLKEILKIPFWLFVLISGLYLVSQLVSALKWKLILAALGERKTLWDCTKSYFLGMYINSFGLGIVGGDIIRAVTINPKSSKNAAISVLFDRFHGFLVLAAIGGFTAVLNNPDWSFKNTLVAVLQLGIVLAGIAGILFSFALKRIHTEKFGKIIELLTFSASLDLPNLIKVTFISVIFHLLQLFTLYIYAKSIGVQLSPFHWAAVMPLINILSSLPLSWNGVGIRESLLLLYLTPVPFEVTQVVNYSLIWLAAVIIGSVVGAVIGIIGNLNLKPKV